jgi:hypothetical protein
LTPPYGISGEKEKELKRECVSQENYRKRKAKQRRKRGREI